jgi:hypothetical protein
VKKPEILALLAAGKITPEKATELLQEVIATKRSQPALHGLGPETDSRLLSELLVAFLLPLSGRPPDEISAELRRSNRGSLNISITSMTELIAYAASLLDLDLAAQNDAVAAFQRVFGSTLDRSLTAPTSGARHVSPSVSG